MDAEQSFASVTGKLSAGAGRERLANPGGKLPTNPFGRVYKAGKVARDEWKRLQRDDVWGKVVGMADLSSIEEYCVACADYESLRAAIHHDTKGPWDHLPGAQRMVRLNQLLTLMKDTRKTFQQYVRAFAYASEASGTGSVGAGKNKSRSPTDASGAKSWKTERVA